MQGLIDSIKSEETYFQEYAQLSPLEAAHLEEDLFAAVRRLLEEEIKFMSE